MTATLPETKVADYAHDGYLYPLRAMSADAAGEYRRKLEAFEADYGQRASIVLRSKAHLVLKWVNELTRLGPVLDAVESIIGSDIVVWGSSFFIKNPHSPGYVAWHQDAPFSNIPEGGEMLTAWIALAPSTLENGCLKVVPGSQHEKVVAHTYRAATDNLLSQGQEIAVEVDDKDAAFIELEPGEFSLHHQFIFHGSNRSESDERRIGLAVRYMKPFRRPAGGDPIDYGMVVRGEDRFNTFISEPSPAYDMEPTAVAYLEDQLVRLHGDRYRKSMM